MQIRQRVIYTFASNFFGQPGYLANLERRANVILPELENRQVFFALCSRSGFTAQLVEATQARAEVMLFDLPALMET